MEFLTDKKVDKFSSRAWSRWVRVGDRVFGISLYTTRSVRLAYSSKRGWQWGCTVNEYEGWNAERRVPEGERVRSVSLGHRDGVTASWGAKGILIEAGLLTQYDLNTAAGKRGMTNVADIEERLWAIGALLDNDRIITDPESDLRHARGTYAYPHRACMAFKLLAENLNPGYDEKTYKRKKPDWRYGVSVRTCPKDAINWKTTVLHPPTLKLRDVVRFIERLV